MPDVGALNIEITSNAEEAAKGLGTLATKLGSVKKNANGFDLTNVQTQIANIVNAVKGSEKTMASLGTLFNATATYFKAFGKITDKININTKPIEDLKKVFDEGIKTGNVGSQLNQLRSALEGEWRVDNAYNAGMALSAIGQGAKDAETTNLAAVATNVSAVAKALNDYADASERIKGVAGEEYIKAMFDALGYAAPSGMAQGIESGKDAVANASAEMTQAGIDIAKDTQQSNSPSKKYEELGIYAAEGYAEGVRRKISTVSAIVAEMVETAIATAGAKTPQILNIASDVMKNTISSVLSGLDMSDVQKSLIQRTANLVADVFKAFEAKPGANLEKLGKVYSEIINGTMAQSTERALKMTQPLQEGLQNVNGELQSAGTSVKSNIDEGISEAVKETVQMNEGLKMTNEELQEQLRIRKEILDAENQARLEKNYGLYRELYMSGEGDWKQQVPEMYGFTDKAIEANETYADALKDTIRECDEYVDQFIAKQNTPAGPLLADVLQQADEAKLAMKQASESAQVLRNAPELTNLTSGMQQVESATQTVTTSFERTKTATRVLTDDMKKLDKELKQKKPDSLKASEGLNNFHMSLKDLKAGIKTAFPLLSKLAKKLKNIVIRRSLTAMFRKIISGAKEGLQNVYEYSKAVGTSFAPAMDSAASSLAQMKNALGAALAPAIQALIPLLQNAVSLFINIINYVNQLFALLNGQNTWTRALPQQAEAFEDSTKSAKKASSAMKDLLADWDELNIIQSQGGSGAGSGAEKTAKDYANMFEEVREFDSTIKGIVDGIKEKFGDVWELVKRIAVAIGGWKLSKVFSNWLGVIGGLVGATLTLDIVFNLVSMFADNYLKSGDVGYLIGDVLTTLIGGVLTKKILGKVLGGKLAMLAIPLTLLVSAFANAKAVISSTDVDALSKENLVTSFLSAAELGGAYAYLSYYGSGLTAGMSAALGAGLGLITFGALIGISAIKDVVETKELSAKTILADIIAAGATGGGLAVLATAMHVGLAGTLALAGGGAIFVLAALIGIQAIIKNQPEAIEWGDKSATEEQIKAFITDTENGMFTSDLWTKLNVYSSKAELADGEEEKIKTQVKGILPDLNSLIAGIDKEKSRENIKSQIFDEGGLIDSYNNMYSAKVAEVKAAITLVPIKNKSGQDQSKDYYNGIVSGYSFLNDAVEGLGQDLAKNLAAAEKAAMEGAATDMYNHNIAVLTQVMLDVSTALSGGQAMTENQESFREGIENWDWNKQSYEDLIKYYEQQRGDVETTIDEAYMSYYKNIDSMIKANESLLYRAHQEGWTEIGGKTLDEIQTEIKRLNELRKGLDENKEASLALAKEYYENGEGKRILREAILAHIQTLPNQAASGVTQFLGDSLIDLFTNQGRLFQTDDSGNVLSINEQASDAVLNIIDEALKGMLGDDYDIVKSMIDTGILSYSDLIDQGVLDAINQAIRLEHQSPQVKEAWNNLINELIHPSEIEETKEQVTPEVEVTPSIDAQEQNEALQEYDSTINATKEAAESATESVNNLAEEVSESSSIVTDATFTLKTTGVISSADAAASAVEDMVTRIQTAFDALQGMEFTFNTGDSSLNGIISTLVPVRLVKGQAASGGVIKSGDLIMANENGNIEMMGKMGNDAVVANNQQIVDGISKGVTTANTGVESRLGAIETMLTRILQKEFVARAVPSSGWGQHGAQSTEAWNKVTG